MGGGVSALPLFPVTTVGSWPRSQELRLAQRRKRRGELSPRAFRDRAREEIRACVTDQLAAGVDLVTDGELGRDNFYSFVTEKLDGTRLMSLAEMLDIVDDRQGFEELLERLDVPAASIRNPTCVGPLARREPLVAEDITFLRGLSGAPVKATLPGPYILSRALWVPEATGSVYASKEELAEAVVAILCAEVAEAVAAGAAVIQLDEPVLTELVFTQGQTRTFMCAALASRKDPAEELEFAVGLINRVAQAINEAGAVSALHVCRGNWSTREETLLAGSYRPLEPVFARLCVRQLVLEYATPRAGDLLCFESKSLGLGAVNPRTPDVEPVESILERAEEALVVYSPERLSLNPDCGFASFSERPMNGRTIARAKVAALAEAARELRRRQDPS
jgi:5-methyltetrahydropteroyltriglutamate--homocysteine methyltransferase